MTQCKKCLANYENSETFTHVCPPWIRALVVLQKAKKNYERKKS